MSLFRTFACFVLLLVGTSSPSYAADYALGQVALTSAKSHLPEQSLQISQDSYPMAMTSGDFDGDGVVDLVVSYASDDGGYLARYRGNHDYLYPFSAEARQRKRDDLAYDAPFFPAAAFVPVKQEFDFLVAGDFDGDGHLDLAGGVRGQRAIDFLRGDGKGGLELSTPVELDGTISLMQSGEVNRRDGSADLVVAIDADTGPQLLIFEALTGAVSQSPERILLPEPARSVAMTELNGQVYWLVNQPELESEGQAAGVEIVATLPVHLNADGIMDRVLLKRGDNSLQVETTRASATVTVNNTTDTTVPGDGLCTLREAIINTNNGGDASGGDCAAGTAAGADEIIFNIPNGGNRATISMTGSLPTITDPVTINGNTQCATPPCIKLDGSGVADPGNTLLNALTLNTGSSVIRGLVFANWPFAGIQLEGAAGGNRVEGNHFGVDFNGTTAAPLLGAGIEVISSGNTIGGTTTAARNIISGNGGNGITLFNTPSSNASGNTVAGNYIGTDITGTIAVGNSLSGIVISEISNNTIGGATAGARNLVSGNKLAGVWIYDTDIPDKASTGNLVQGNLIGTDITGEQALGNFYDGVRIWDASSNTIGGTSAAARNIISGNGHVEGHSNGVSIFQTTYWNLPTNNNLVYGNYIGTDISGTEDLGNKYNGVLIGNAMNNAIGGTVTGAGNLISGQEISGIYVFSANYPTTGNTIQGNFIGTNAAGAAAIGHSIGGVYIDKGANNNLVGGTNTGAGNVVSGNAHGVIIWESSNNTVQGNLIGTNAAGTGAIGNTSNGVYIDKGASNNLIGGTTVAARNLISENVNGVAIVDSANNQILGNNIRNQADVGVVVRGASAGNKMSQNLVFNNTALGIDLGFDGPTANDDLDLDSGPNNLQNFPILATVTAGNPVITGNLNSLPNTQFTIEYFSNTACNSSGFGEGQFYLGTKQVTTNGSGNASVGTTLGTPVPAGYFVTATATAPDGSTSEFSPCVAALGSGDVIFKNGFES